MAQPSISSSCNLAFCLMIPALLAHAAPVTAARSPKMPLHFEATADGSLTARQGPYTLALKSSGTVVTVADRAHHRAAAVTTRLAGAASEVKPEGQNPLAAKANYFRGSDPAAWRTGAPLFAQALERSVYPGVDLVFHGDGGSLEYDFRVHPGASARQIALDIAGASGVRIGRDGGLRIETTAGEIHWNKPEVYQWKDGVRQHVAGAFALHGRRVSFNLGAYDHRRELIIDPTLAFATYLGGSDNEAAKGVTVDASGNIYVTGFSYSADLHTTSGTLQSAYHGGTTSSDMGGDVFVAKYASSGTLTFLTYVGGSGDDAGTSIAVDSAGNVYVTGFTTSTDFPNTGSLQRQFGGAGGSGQYAQQFGDAFVTKLNPGGSGLVYSTYLGGSKDDTGEAIAVDSAGNAYVGGNTLSSDFPLQNAAHSSYGGAGGSAPFCCGSNAPYEVFGDGFVAKVNAAGTGLVFSTYLGGSKDDAVTSLAIDGSGSVYVGGNTVSSDFPVLNGYQKAFGGAASTAAQPVITLGDGFVAKFDSSGTPKYATYLGGSGDDIVMGLAVDSTGAAYVTGFTSSANFPIAGSVAQKTFTGPAKIIEQRDFVWGDAFVTKLDPSGGSLAWSTFLGGTEDDAGMAIALDPALNVIVGGFTNSLDFPLSSNAEQKAFAGNGPPGYNDFTGDAFVAAVKPDGSAFEYVSYYGGNSSDAISGIAVGPQGQVVAIGATTSNNLRLSSNAPQKVYGGDNMATVTEAMGDSFVAVFSGIASTVSSNPAISAVVNGAAPGAGLAPGTAAAVYGTNLAANSSAGAKVGNQAAQVIFASTTQWTIIIPANATPGPTTVEVGGSPAFSITLNQYAPALFTADNSGEGVATAQRVLSSSTPSVSPATPAFPGDTVYIFATGLGMAGADGTLTVLPTATLGGNSITVTSAVPVSALPGGYQLTIQIPDSTAAGNPALVLSIGGVSSQSGVTLPIGAYTGTVITGVVNGASFQKGIAPNTWVTIQGVNLSGVTDSWNNFIVNGTLPTKFDSVSVSVGGQPGYLEYISQYQINLVAPNVPPGPVQVTVTNSTGTSASFTVNVAQYSPTFFEWPNHQVVATRQDYSYAVAPGTFAGATTVAAKPGDVLILWGTGFGPTAPAAPAGVETPLTQTYNTSSPVTVTINNTPVQVYGAALAGGFAGLYQVGIQVPQNMPDGMWPIVASVGGVQSPGNVVLAVHQ